MAILSQIKSPARGRGMAVAEASDWRRNFIRGAVNRAVSELDDSILSQSGCNADMEFQRPIVRWDIRRLQQVHFRPHRDPPEMRDSPSPKHSWISRTTPVPILRLIVGAMDHRASFCTGNIHG